MLKTISSSDLRSQIRRVLDDVGYGRAQYVVEKFGEPTAAIISMEDFRLLRAAIEKEATLSLQELLADLRARSKELAPGELDSLVEEARQEFYQLHSSGTHAG
jgi:prevent-host-death family protein